MAGAFLHFETSLEPRWALVVNLHGSPPDSGPTASRLRGTCKALGRCLSEAPQGPVAPEAVILRREPH